MCARERCWAAGQLEGAGSLTWGYHYMYLRVAAPYLRPKSEIEVYGIATGQQSSGRYKVVDLRAEGPRGVRAAAAVFITLLRNIDSSAAKR